jgi:hypothetical protein
MRRHGHRPPTSRDATPRLTGPSMRRAERTRLVPCRVSAPLPCAAGAAPAPFGADDSCPVAWGPRLLQRPGRRAALAKLRCGERVRAATRKRQAKRMQRAMSVSPWSSVRQAPRCAFPDNLHHSGWSIQQVCCGMEEAAGATRPVQQVPSATTIDDAVFAGRYRGPVAQWSEQGTHNPSVAGSIPAGPTC